MKLKLKRGRGGARPIVPSKSTVAAYQRLTSSDRPLGSKELCMAAGLSHSGGAAILTAMFKSGLLSRRRTLNNEYLYRWDPKPAAGALAREIADAADDQRLSAPASSEEGAQDASMVIVLEHLGNALLAAAQAIKSRGAQGQMTARMADRRADLARIHILKKELALQDDEYRDLLFTVARVRSSADLDHTGRAAVVSHLSALAEKYKPNEWGFIDRAATDRQKLLRKICAMCRAERRSKAYADGVARQMFGVDLVEFCKPDQLHRIVSALEFDRRRREAKASA